MHLLADPQQLCIHEECYSEIGTEELKSVSMCSCTPVIIQVSKFVVCLFTLKWKETPKQEVLHDWELRQHLNLVHLNHARIHLHAMTKRDPPLHAECQADVTQMSRDLSAPPHNYTSRSIRHSDRLCVDL